MAQTLEPELKFATGGIACGDCAERKIIPLEKLPNCGDDFDWLVRDYDGFRLFMLEELAARFPMRRNWNPADLEVVIVEAFSVVLDQLSDQLDRVVAEAFLETARQPESVRRLLAMIGYDAVALAEPEADIPDSYQPPGEQPEEKLERLRKFLPALRGIRDDYVGAIEKILEKEPNTAPAKFIEEEGGILSYYAEGGKGADQLNKFVQTEGCFSEDPDNKKDIILKAVQAFLDSAPTFVEKARNFHLKRYWQKYPHAMDAARSAGPQVIHNSKRMVTEKDYAERMEDHPLVLRSYAYTRWNGSWNTVYVAVILLSNSLLDEPLIYLLRQKVAKDKEMQILNEFNKKYALKKRACPVLAVEADDGWTIAGFNGEGDFLTERIENQADNLFKELKKDDTNLSQVLEHAASRGHTFLSVENAKLLQNEVNSFNRQREIPPPDWNSSPTLRTVLRPYVDAYRMAGQEVLLLDAVTVGINISISIHVEDNYFQSEVRQDVQETLGSGVGGFFAPGRLQFAQDLYAGDIIQAVMALDGVKVVCLNLFKRVGKGYPDRADGGRIQLDGLEVAICDNNPLEKERGVLDITLYGGRMG